MHQLRFNKSLRMALMSAHRGHSNSDSFHFLRFRNDSHVSLVIVLASSSDSSGSASSIKSSSFPDSSASSSYSFLESWSLFGVCAQITTNIIQAVSAFTELTSSCDFDATR